MNGQINAPVPSPPPPDTSNPEPIPATPGDPEKGRVPVPAPGKPEHPKESVARPRAQAPAGIPGPGCSQSASKAWPPSSRPATGVALASAIQIPNGSARRDGLGAGRAT